MAAGKRRDIADVTAMVPTAMLRGWGVNVVHHATRHTSHVTRHTSPYVGLLRTGGVEQRAQGHTTELAVGCCIGAVFLGLGGDLAC